MHTKILTQKKLFPSAALLRSNLQPFFKEKIWVTTNPNKINTPSVIRWGNLDPISDQIIEINPREFIILCSKINFSNLLYKYTNKFFSVITFYPMTETPEKFPVVIRETLTSFGGDGIFVVTSIDEFKNFQQKANYWSQWIPMESEFRVHVIGGKIVRIFKKECTTNDEFPIRNSKNCSFSLRENFDSFPKLQTVIENISNTLPKNTFYGLDIGYNKQKKQYTIIEANTAPGLNNNTAEIYAKEIYEMLTLEN